MARPTIGSGAPGGAVMLPSIEPAAPPPMVGIGAVAAPMGPGGFDLAGAFGGGPTGGSLSLGAAVPMAPAGTRSMGDQRRAEQREKVRATGGLGAAAAPSAPPPEAPPSALQSALGEREGELSSLYSILATPKQQVRVDNPMRRIAELEAQQFYGGDRSGPLQLEPFTPPPIEPGEDEFSYMQRVQALQDEDVQRQFQEAETLNNVRDIGFGGHLGMAEARIQAQEGQGAAELAQMERVAEVQKQAAEQSMQATEQARQADIERRDFARMQRDAITEQQKVQQAARAKLQALPELDPNRAFKSMSGGARFWQILGSLAGGLIGSNQVNEQLMDIATKDLEAQKANAAQTFDAANAADAAVGQQMGLYRDLLGAAGDEAAADAMFLQLQLEDASKMLEAELARTTIPVARAELQQSLVNLKGQIDEQQRVIETRLATTPASFLKTYDPLGAGVRKKLEARAQRLEGERTDFQKLGVASEEKALDREGELRKAGATTEKERTTQAQQLAATHAKEVAKMQAASNILRDFVAKAREGDIAGRGLDTYFATEEGRKVRETLREAQRRQLRYESQGVIGEDELDDRVDSMMSGWGDNELLENAERLISANNEEVTAREYGLPEEARQIYYRNPNLAPLPARGASLPSRGADADAAALGGSVVR